MWHEFSDFRKDAETLERTVIGREWTHARAHTSLRSQPHTHMWLEGWMTRLPSRLRKYWSTVSSRSKNSTKRLYEMSATVERLWRRERLPAKLPSRLSYLSLPPGAPLSRRRHAPGSTSIVRFETSTKRALLQRQVVWCIKYLLLQRTSARTTRLFTD